MVVGYLGYTLGSPGGLLQTLRPNPDQLVQIFLDGSKPQLLTITPLVILIGNQVEKFRLQAGLAALYLLTAVCLNGNP